MSNTKTPSSTTQSGSLDDLRTEINRIDRSILELLSTRRKCSEEVIKEKDTQGSALRDPRREQEILADLLRSGREQGLDLHYVTSIFQLVIEDSIRLQQRSLQRKVNDLDSERRTIRVAFHGTEGSYCHLAARHYFTSSSDESLLVGYRSFEEVIESVENGSVEYAAVPLENTTSGAIHEVYDLLLKSKLSIVGELEHRLSHSLLGLTTTPLSAVRKILCNPLAAAECSSFLRRHPEFEVELMTDTGAALERLKNSKDDSVAVIAGSEVVDLLGLIELESEISNQAENFTRYLVLARLPMKVDPRVPSKTSLVLATEQKPGSLVEALLVFRDKQVNLTRLESRPLPGNSWEEMFYLDFEGNLQEERIQTVLHELGRHTRYLKVLGCYPSFDVVKTFPSPQMLESVIRDAPPLEEPKPVEKKKESKSSSVTSSYKLASREYRAEDTIIEVQGVKIGGDDNFLVMAGPCSVESYEQVMSCAREARNHGARILRGGVFKPRTSPYSFQGLGLEGLDMLVEAGRAHGLPVITEVLAAEDLEAVAAKADIIQVGARNMQNFSLLKEMGRIHRPVMLKRGMSSSIEELLQAVEYILAGGNHQVILCERGIRTFETATRSTLDLSAVPVLRERTHLPIFVDPSHAAGTRDLVPPLAKAAKAVGAHGIIVEFHPEPEKALSDGPQALRYPQFEKMMAELLKA